MDSAKYLIVNADDFGYYDCVSRGILKCANAGSVTATGIFANAPHFEEHITWLKQCAALDHGVHLNLTDGEPLTNGIRTRLGKWGGRFPGKLVMTRWIITGRISAQEVAAELRAQVARCRAENLNLRFLNSHEHVHMLPSVFKITQDLASEFGIQHVRCSLPDGLGSVAPVPLLRDLALRWLGGRNRRSRAIQSPSFLGMSASGKLGMRFLERRLRALRPGIYELMCHPGACAPGEVSSARLESYHDWRGELEALSSTAFRELCKREHINIIGYRHLRIANGVLRVDRTGLRADQPAGASAR